MTTRNHSIRRAMMTAFGAAALLAVPALVSAGGDRHKDAAAAKSAAFTETDADGNGSLSPAEYANFHTVMRQKMAARRFERLDANSDGALSQDELAADHGKRGHHKCDHEDTPES